MSALKGKYVGNYSSLRLNAAEHFSYKKAGYVRTIATEDVTTVE